MKLCQWIWFNYWREPSLSKQVFGFSVILLMILQTIARSEQLKRSILWRRATNPEKLCKSPAPSHEVMGHWTAAASSDVFTNTTDFLVEAQSLVILLIGITTAIVTAFQAHVAWQNASAPRFHSRMLLGCCPAGVTQWDGDQCSSMCKLGFLGKKVPLTFSIGLLSIISCSTMFFPTKLWSPVTMQAVEKSNHVVMWRLLHVPWLALVFGLINAALVVIFSISNWKPESVYITQFWEAYWFTSLGVILAELITIVFLAPWATLARIPEDILHNISTLLACRKISSDDGRRYVLFWECRLSWRYRQLVLLFSCILSFSVDVVHADGTQSYYVWVMRGVILLLLLVSRDKPADFKTLEMTGAGFGLCVNAKQLRQALECHLKGKKYSGKVLRYKATLLRMSDTLVISYRWNDTAVELGGGVTINMTEWQMRQMADAINCTGCLYVWMDNCALPQDGGKLLTRLLSRMMAVYAAGFMTLVMLSREYDTDRYHQRVWTLQEYCSAARTMIVKEDLGEHETDTDDRMAIVGREAENADAVRHQYMASVAHCVPVWLSEDIQVAVRELSANRVNDIQEMYCTLSRQRHCRFAEDAVRALYPLLWVLPAESESELHSLISSIEDVHQIPQTETRALLEAFDRGAGLHRGMTLKSGVSHTASLSHEVLGVESGVEEESSEIMAAMLDDGSEKSMQVHKISFDL
eukprot:CAMPEP_0117675554 /NCGR_PEP_ID=MMETSP0804-20121206/15672_1 /TAXON_ID=1074897 /ORGANISM="Tetraselmis astigmatica, Strain CCMP880" /LENGTH=694 /DNA_ID=CAMNT_0005484575 /DNA_START=576 /DNA_END=2660 /DNA_ORIENTATION=-